MKNAKAIKKIVVVLGVLAASFSGVAGAEGTGDQPKPILNVQIIIKL